MRLVGLTGGIASGKSSVSQELQQSGLPIVDADKIARAALNKNTPGYKRVVKAFGKTILLPDGEVDRAKLGDIVFSDPAKRKQLNDALRPEITRGLLWEVFKHWISGTPTLILDVPLLFETGMNRFTRPVVVVWVDFETEKARLMARDGLSEEQAENRIGAQWSLEWKREQADIVIDNSRSREETSERVQRVVEVITSPPDWLEILHSRNFVVGVIAVSLLSGLCKLVFSSSKSP